MKKMTIQGHVFEIDEPYAEGHKITELEAKALNQTRIENIRNNFAKTVKEAGDEPDVAVLQEKLNSYAAGYVFSIGGGRVTDPLEKEKRSIAILLVDAKIAEAGHSKRAYIEANGREKYDALVSQVSEMSEVVARAEKTIKERQTLAGKVTI